MSTRTTGRIKNHGRDTLAVAFLVIAALLGSQSVLHAATGWAVGPTGVILKSIDGGESWFLLDSNSNATLESVYFTSASTGYAVGLQTILKTTDGGETWVDTYTGGAALQSVFFINSSRGWAVGTSGQMVKTTNGGNTWFALNSGSNATLQSVFFTSSSTGFAVGLQTILKTTDGGSTWEDVYAGGAALQSVFFINSNIGWAVGTTGQMVKTTDGGDSWFALSSGSNATLQSVFFTSSNTGYAVGLQTILRTTNGGTSWEDVYAGGAALQSIFFINASTGWAVGTSGAVLKTTNGGMSWVPKDSDSWATLLSVFFVADTPDCDDSDDDGYYAQSNCGTAVDCDDGNSSVHPGATEVCNNTDDDCDGSVDEGVQSTFYRDADSDGYGNPSVTSTGCSAPAGYVSNASDCNDSNSGIHPGATELCNSVDDDCDGSVDEGVQSTFYRDADNDGYGNINDAMTGCAAPAGYVTNSGDCDDSNPNCTADCTDADGDGFCVTTDCNDAVASCSIDCSDANGNGTPDCAEVPLPPEGLRVVQTLSGSPGAVSLVWDPSVEAVGYRLYYGTGAGQYSFYIDTSSETHATIDELSGCTTWHFAVRAYNVAGESWFSNEVSSWPQPFIDGISPAAARQGDQLALSVNGSNFHPGAMLEWDNPGVFLNSSVVVSCTEIQAAAAIEPTAPGMRAAEIGPITVRVTNPDGLYGENSDAFDVLINPFRFDINQTDEATSGRLDGKDVVWLGRRFGGQEWGPLYHPDYDFTGNGWIDGNELALLAANLGRCWDGANWTSSACPYMAAVASGAESAADRLPSSSLVGGFDSDLLVDTPYSVQLAEAEINGPVVTLKVDIADVMGVYGAAFDLVHDPAISTFEGWLPGAALEQGGHVPIYQVHASHPGRVVVAVSRRGDAPAVDVRKQTLIKLKFRMTSVGASPIGFEFPALTDGQLPPQPIPGITWSGGRLIADGVLPGLLW